MQAKRLRARANMGPCHLRELTHASGMLQKRSIPVEEMMPFRERKVKSSFAGEYPCKFDTVDTVAHHFENQIREKKQTMYLLCYPSSHRSVVSAKKKRGKEKMLKRLQ